MIRQREHGLRRVFALWLAMVIQPTLLQSGKVLVTGGCTVSNCSTDTAASELYDPVSNGWSTTGNLNTARDSHTPRLLKTGKVFAVRGSPGGIARSCDVYGPSTG